MVLEIDGVNIVPYIAFGGFQWQRSDLDGPGSGRDLSSALHRNRLGTKRRLDVTCRPLTSKEVRIVLTAIMPEWVSVRYYDPQQGAVITRTMYSNNNPASYMIKHPDGTEWWNGVTFPLTEK